MGRDAESWLRPTWLGQFALKAMLTARQKENAGPAKWFGGKLTN